jgi:hypothetical protein
MKWFFVVLVVIMVSALSVAVCAAQSLPGGRYFSQTPPGFTPAVFAPGIISLSNRYEYCLVYSPNQDECVFGVTNSTWGVFNLWYTKMAGDSTWSDPVPAPFQGNGDGLFPAWSADGNEVYFASSRPAVPSVNIWRSDRTGSGWSAPVVLDPPLNSTSHEWGGSLTDDGTFYFSSERPGGVGAADLYRAVTAPDGEVTVENLGPTVNSPQLEGSACIARDGSFLIFESQRPGGFGQSDLYITLNQDGTWSAPRNLGPAINTSWFEDGASISPDGKYLFFNRRIAYVTGTQTEIWWVDLRAALHPEQSGVNDPGGPRPEQTILRNEPNPFGPSTTITYSTPASGFVALRVYDVLGREVRSLVNGPQVAGVHTVDFDLPSGEGLPGGIYYCSLQVGDRRVKTTKMVAVR